MRLLFIQLFIAFSSSLSYAQAKMTKEEYINKYFSLAVEEMNRYKIPASIKLAQGLIETENGNSLLATKANNHFGIKCKAEWTGPIFIKDDDTKDECFRSYITAEESYRDHSLFLMKPRYSKLLSYDMTDYRSWAYGLKEAGYATNPNYPAMLIKYIEDLKLFQFDKFGMEKNIATATNSQKPILAAISEEELIKLRKQIANNIDLVIVNENFDIYKVASLRKLPVNALMEFNDIEGEQTMRLGQNFFLNKKEKMNSKGKHSVLIGESLYDISQMYGVNLRQLRKYNKLESWEQSHVGETIYLSGVREDFMKTRPFYSLERERIEGNLRLFIPVDMKSIATTPSIEVKPNNPIETISNPGTNELSKIAVDTKDPIITIAANKANIDTAKEGMPSQIVTETKLSDVANPSEKVWINHLIKPKETIFRISKMFDCKPNEILNWNAINMEQGLKIGQSLRIHTLYPKGMKIDVPVSEEIRLMSPIDLAKPVPNIPQKPRAIILKAPPAKPNTDTAKLIQVKGNTRQTFNGMRVEKISMEELYHRARKDTSRLDTTVRRRIKLSGD